MKKMDQGNECAVRLVKERFFMVSCAGNNVRVYSFIVTTHTNVCLTAEIVILINIKL